MDKEDWYERRDDRTIRYGARRLDHARWIALSASPGYLRRYDGQVAAIVAANLFSRMTPSVALCFPDVEIHPVLPWAGRSLHEFILGQMKAADPHGQFMIREQLASDFGFHVGAGNATANIVAHGTGWNAYIGPGPSSLPESPDLNCIGSSLAVVLAASQLFAHRFDASFAPYICNGLNWREEPVTEAPAFEPGVQLGNIAVAGVGSVGTAALYFLTLATREFRPDLIDMDRVKIHNLDRSPIFRASDLDNGCKMPDGSPEPWLKVASTRDYLQAAGVRDVRIDDKPLHESTLWNDRQAGETDLLIAAANEHKVRYYIEANYPPVQIYATTGGNWQVSAIRHIPDSDVCSLCLFPADREEAPTACATGPVPEVTGDEQVDAALPFLSFAAGLMTAAETLKLALPGYPFSANRAQLSMRPAPSLMPARLSHRPGCFCETRNKDLHRLMLAGTRYANLSDARAQPISVRISAKR